MEMHGIYLKGLNELQPEPSRRRAGQDRQPVDGFLSSPVWYSLLTLFQYISIHVFQLKQMGAGGEGLFLEVFFFSFFFNFYL